MVLVILNWALQCHEMLYVHGKPTHMFSACRQGAAHWPGLVPLTMLVTVVWDGGGDARS